MPPPFCSYIKADKLNSVPIAKLETPACTHPYPTPPA